MARTIGIVLLCVFLILVGIAKLTNIEIALMNVLQGIAAIGAACCLLWSLRSGQSAP